MPIALNQVTCAIYRELRVQCCGTHQIPTCNGTERSIFKILQFIASYLQRLVNEFIRPPAVTNPIRFSRIRNCIGKTKIIFKKYRFYCRD